MSGTDVISTLQTTSHFVTLQYFGMFAVFFIRKTIIKSKYIIEEEMLTLT